MFRTRRSDRERTGDHAGGRRGSDAATYTSWDTRNSEMRFSEKWNVKSRNGLRSNLP